jgi:LmbE family N-acetylglucosaminyl deacetylase
MLPLSIGGQNKALSTILCLGAHCDDIEIGCGGTLLKLLDDHKDLYVFWYIFSSTPSREAEARRSSALFLSRTHYANVIVRDFSDGYLPFHGKAVKDCFEDLKREISPDLIFTHSRHDRHQDHRLIADMTWNTFRDHFILEYEIPKYEGDLECPNYYVGLPPEVCDTKVKSILECYTSQSNKTWFSADMFMALLRLRGMEANAASGLAEGFHCRKAVYGL